MAKDTIARLKLDTSSYDAKLKKATEGLRDYAQECRNVGGTLEYVDDGVLEFIKALGSADTVAKNGKGQLREYSQALNDLTLIYRQMSDAEKKSAPGRALAESIEQLKQKAGEVRDTIDDVNAAIKRAASDTRAFDQLAGAAQLSTAAFQGLQGASKLLGIDMGDNVEIIAKLQAAMGVVNSLTTIQTALQKESAVMQAMVALQTKANAAAQSLLAKNTTLATVAGKAFNVVAKANPAVLLISTLTALFGVTKLFTKNTDESTEALKRQKEAIDRTNQAEGAYSQTMSSTYAGLMTKYKELQEQWRRLESDHSRTEWIKKNASEFNKLGLSVHSAKEAEDVFEKNTNEVVQGFIKRAQAAAYAAKLTELYNQQMNLTLKRSQLIRENGVKAGSAVPQSIVSGGMTADASGGTYNNGMYRLGANGVYTFTERGAAAYNSQYGQDASVNMIDLELFNLGRQIDEVAGKLAELSGSISSGSSGGGGDGKSEYEPHTQALDMKPMQGVGLGDVYDRWGNLMEAPRALTPEEKQRRYILGQLRASMSSVPSLDFPEQSEEAKNYIKRRANRYDREQTYAELGEKFDESSKTWANMNSNLNNIVKGVESLGIEVPSGFKKMIGLTQTVSTVLSSITSVLWLLNTSNWAETIIPFHRGGIVRAAMGYTVPGNYGFDAVPAMLTSGEVVLNRAQQGVLASRLSQQRSSHTETPYVSGELIYLGLNNYLRGIGRGEIVTAN